MEENFITLYNVLKTYTEEDEIDEINKAYLFASKAHESQIRKSGEPYIIHPIAVSVILANQKLPKNVIISGLLHDVVEDTEYTLEDISENFNDEVAYIVDGVTKLGHIEDYTYDELQAENHRKILIAASKDVRVLLVKLADRLHNMRTIKYMNNAKQKLIANETLEVYAPIAHRLGMYEMKWELEDLSFKTLNPEKYHEIAAKLELKKSQREKIIKELLADVEKLLKNRGIEAIVKGRSKHIYSIYKKLNQGKHFEQILDLFAFRIIVKSIPECYISLGVIHEEFKPIPLKFKDYIPTPKHNMYQSIHTTVLTKDAIPVEFQIRTERMDQVSETGIASHWLYKEEKSSEELQNEINKKLTWLRKLVEDGSLEDQDSKTFMNTVKGDFLSKTIFVFTPNGDIIELPIGSTVLDFAFYVHTKLGLEALSSKVNDKVVSLFYKLQMGDVVKIITSNHAYPSINWLAKVKTNRAKEALKKYYKDEENKKIQEEGYNIFLGLQETNPQIDFKTIEATDKIYNLMKKFNISKKEKFFLAIGIGEIDPEEIINTLSDKKLEIDKIIQPFSIKDFTEECEMKMCKYCSPLPGDELRATKVDIKGINQFYIHRADCNITGENYEVITNEVLKDNKYVCRMEVVIKDSPNKLYDLLGVIKANKIYNITSVYARGSLGGIGKIKLSLLISNTVEYNKLKKEIEKLAEVYRITRTINN
ncbi:MAG: RelA/SpoT family protein [Mycoplasmatales bacterium]